MNKELVITGVGTLAVGCMLAALAYSWLAVLLVLIGSFGVLMICIGLEIRNPLDIESDEESA